MGRLENLLAVQSLVVVDGMLDGTLGSTLDSTASAAPGGPAPSRPAPGGPPGHATSEAAALVTLRAHADQGVGWLSRVLGLTDSGATRLVQRLVSAGLVEQAAGDDRRGRSLRLTPAGRTRADEVLASRRHRVAAVLSPLSAAERAILEGLLETVVTALAHDRPTALRTCRLCDRAACGGPTGDQCPLEHTVPAAGPPRRPRRDPA